MTMPATSTRLRLVPSVPPRATPRKRVVLLDDDLAMLRALERLLTRAGFAVVATHDARRALEVVVRDGADAIVSDLYMPDVGGNVVLAMVAKASPRTARLLLTSESDFSTVSLLSLPASVDAFLAKRDASTRLVSTLHDLFGDRPREDVASAPEQARSLALAVQRAIGRPEDESHCARVALWSTFLARAVDLDEATVRDLELAALLHDIGEVGLREGLMDKPGLFTPDERAEMQRHPVLGASMLADIPLLRRAMPIIESHHERFDGGGYPRGLAGNAIPVGGRVFQIVDAYDAIRRDRPHRAYLRPGEPVREASGRSDAEARIEISRHAGSQFDPEILRVFARIDPAVWASVVAGVHSG
jgi:putative nucleotidyltransferase with HDIG domain